MKISDFVVGLGFDTSDFEKGMKRASSDLGGFRSDILQLGATLSGAFGLKELTFDFARQNLELSQTASLYGELSTTLYGLDKAAQTFGSSEGQIVETLGKIASARANFEKLGKIGIFEDLALIGVDFEAINNAKTEVEAMYVLANQISKLDRKSQLIATNILGLSPSELDLLKQGSEQIKNLSEELQKARPHTKEMEEASKKLIAQWEELTVRIGGRADRLSIPLVTALGDLTESTNEWFESNQKIIDQKIDGFVEKVSENFDDLLGIAIGFGATKLVSVFASLAKTIPIVGDGIEKTSESLKGMSSKATTKGILALGSILPQLIKATPALGLAGMVATTVDWDSVIKNQLEQKSSGDVLQDDALSDDVVKSLIPNQTEGVQDSVKSSVLQSSSSASSGGDIHTTANINVIMNEEVIGSAVVRMQNGQIRATLGDVLISEDR